MDLHSALSQCELFAALDADATAALAATAQVVELKGGSTLFEADGPSDSMFIVLSGRLRATTPAGFGGEIGVLESVGETGVVTEQPRTARVIALRDTRLLCIGREQLMQVLDRFPKAWIAMVQVIVARLRQNRLQQKRAAVGLRSMAIVAATAGVGGRECVRRLVAALAAFVEVRCIDSKQVDRALGAGASAAPFDDPAGNERIMDWLSEAESSCELLVYDAGHRPGPWLRRCLRQSDRILLVADAQEPAQASGVIDEMLSGGATAEVQCLLRRGAEQQSTSAQSWRLLMNAKAHYFWRSGASDSFASIARQLTARGIGVVLGGGGARGFAHIGLLRALDELGIPVDVAGGSSMGAFIAALRARGLSARDITTVVRETFVDKNYLNDYTLPRVALIRGQRFLARLREVFGDGRIEDLAVPYFCVTTNLTRGTPMVHDTGPLAIWVGASMSIPGVAPPVAYQSDLLADGGVVNSLPTDIMLDWGRGPIIASDVSTEGVISAPGIVGPDPEALLRWTGDTPRPSLLDILFRTATLTSESGTQARAERADVYLRMPTAGRGIFDWRALDDIVRDGYAYAMARLPDLRECLLEPRASGVRTSLRT